MAEWSATPGLVVFAILRTRVRTRVKAPLFFFLSYFFSFSYFFLYPSVLSFQFIHIYTYIHIRCQNSEISIFIHLCSCIFWLLLLCWCFTAFRHFSGHFGCGRLTYPLCSWASLRGSLTVLSAHSFASN